MYCNWILIRQKTFLGLSFPITIRPCLRPLAVRYGNVKTKTNIVVNVSDPPQYKHNDKYNVFDNAVTLSVVHLLDQLS